MTDTDKLAEPSPKAGGELADAAELLRWARLDFEAALAGMPFGAERIAQGQQFNAYESASNDEDDDPADWEFFLSLGPIDDRVQIMGIEGEWRAKLIEAALRVALRDRSLRAPEQPDRNAVLEEKEHIVAMCMDELDKLPVASPFARSLRQIMKAVEALRASPDQDVERLREALKAIADDRYNFNSIEPLIERLHTWQQAARQALTTQEDQGNG